MCQHDWSFSIQIMHGCVWLRIMVGNPGTDLETTSEMIVEPLVAHEDILGGTELPLPY